MQFPSRRERLTWFVAGAIGTVAGPAGLSGVMWIALATDVMPALRLVPIGCAAVLILTARAVRSTRARRIWSALAWFLLGGPIFLLGLDWTAKLFPADDRSFVRLAVSFALLATILGGLAVITLLIGGRLLSSNQSNSRVTPASR